MRNRMMIAGLACSLWTTEASGGPRCGAERHTVKVGEDETASLVSGPVELTTVERLTSLARPASVPSDRRVSDSAETRRWRVEATVQLIRRERDDGDYHLVLRDDAGRTMIAESPSPECVAKSLWRSDLVEARAAVERLKVGSRVVVTGVGFFDYPHRQTGVAPNAIELHPILSVEVSR